jgi:hypothetical protein
MPQQEFDARLAAHCLDKIAQMEGIMPFLGGWGRYIYILLFLSCSWFIHWGFLDWTIIEMQISRTR